MTSQEFTVRKRICTAAEVSVFPVWVRVERIKEKV